MRMPRNGFGLLGDRHRISGKTSEQGTQREQGAFAASFFCNGNKKNGEG